MARLMFSQGVRAKIKRANNRQTKKITFKECFCAGLLRENKACKAFVRERAYST